MHICFAVPFLFCYCDALKAQHFNIHNPITLPDKSQAAQVSQRIGYTDIIIDYHSPGAHGRTIWGELVPYGKVWRAGANTNTRFTITDSVEIEGMTLGAGTYGLHVLPEEEHWTFIFSQDHSSWGSYFYESAMDALRVTVPVQRAPEEREWLSYDFHRRERGSVVVMLTWGERRASFSLGIDINKLALDRIRKELKTDAYWEWFSWCQAADYCAQYDINTVEALDWINRSIEMRETFSNWDVKAKLLDQLERNEEAKHAINRALEVGSYIYLERYGRRLMGGGDFSQAVAVFDLALQKNDTYWRAHLNRGNALVELDRRDEAIQAFTRARKHAPESQQQMLDEKIKAGTE